MERESHAGTWGWIGLAAYVAAFDLLAPETMSHAADRALEDPKMRLAAWAIGGIVVGHVFNLIPEQYDIIHKMFPDGEAS